MQINLTFRHTESSKVLKDHIEEILQKKLAKYFIKPIGAHVTLTAEGTRHAAEIIITENDSQFTAKALTHDMYLSVDQALDKIETQLKKYKEKVKTHHKKPKRTPAPRAEAK